MSLDATARLSNVMDSLKKYFFDSLYTTEGKEVMFDKSLSTPDLADKSIDRWVVINFGALDMGTLSEFYLNIFVCSRNAGISLATKFSFSPTPTTSGEPFLDAMIFPSPSSIASTA